MSTPLLMIDTAGCGFNETSLGTSKGNNLEAAIVVDHVDQLVGLGVAPADIAVISFYDFQVTILRRLLLDKYPYLEVKSVDGFQGCEKEAVVISMVRSNAGGEVGFLRDPRRINVAVTRARRQLTVVCDSRTVSRDPCIRSLLGHIRVKGRVVDYSKNLDRVDRVDADGLFSL